MHVILIACRNKQHDRLCQSGLCGNPECDCLSLFGGLANCVVFLTLLQFYIVALMGLQKAMIIVTCRLSCQPSTKPFTTCAKNNSCNPRFQNFINLPDFKTPTRNMVLCCPFLPFPIQTNLYLSIIPNLPGPRIHLYIGRVEVSPSACVYQTLIHTSGG